jgi:hypothetical protein
MQPDARGARTTSLLAPTDARLAETDASHVATGSVAPRKNGAR